MTAQHIRGFKKEEEVHPIMEKVLGVKLNPTGRYDRFDFYNTDEKILVELKSRTNNFDTYPTTLINNSKLRYANKKIDRGYRAFLFFNFKDDSTYYIEYKKNWGFRCDRTYTYIPIKSLIKADHLTSGISSE